MIHGLLYVILISLLCICVIFKNNNCCKLFKLIPANSDFEVKGYVVLNSRQNLLLLNDIKIMNNNFEKKYQISYTNIEVLIENKVSDKEIFSYTMYFDDNKKVSTLNEVINNISIYIDNFNYNYKNFDDMKNIVLKISSIDIYGEKNSIDILLFPINY